MGNCLLKEKNTNSEHLAAEFFFLQKENLRSYDLLLREITNIQKSITELQILNSDKIQHTGKTTYV